VRIKEDRKLPASLGPYKDRISFDELTTFGFNLRAQLSKLKDLASLSPWEQTVLFSRLKSDAFFAEGIAKGSQEIFRETLNTIEKFGPDDGFFSNELGYDISEHTYPDRENKKSFGFGLTEDPYDGVITFDIVQHTFVSSNYKNL
jgi:hypothetical protein